MPAFELMMTIPNYFGLKRATTNLKQMVLFKDLLT